MDAGESNVSLIKMSVSFQAVYCRALRNLRFYGINIVSEGASGRS